MTCSWRPHTLITMECHRLTATSCLLWYTIDKTHPEIIPLMRRFMHIDNWGLISASLEALAVIGTEEALQAMQEIRDRWYAELNKTQKRIADMFLAESKSAKSDEQ